MKPDWIKALEAATDKFWKEEYPQKTFEQRADYWKETMEKGMKEQEKLGLPPFSVFNKAWYDSVKEQEPEIDRLISFLFEYNWKIMVKIAFFDAISTAPIVDEAE